MLMDKQNELMSDLLFTVHHHAGDEVTWKPPITPQIHQNALTSKFVKRIEIKVFENLLV